MPDVKVPAIKQVPVDMLTLTKFVVVYSNASGVRMVSQMFNTMNEVVQHGTVAQTNGGKDFEYYELTFPPKQ